MKLMAGILPPDTGQIDTEGLAPQDITMVLRKPYLMHDTVIRNLTYPLKLRGIKPDVELVEYYLELAGLQDDREIYAPGLSSGQQQKLALIRAMIFSPKLVLIDEAFSNLDMESTAAFEWLILERQRTETATYLICAHQLSHIQRLCGYVFFMHDGRIEAEGPTDEMLLRPKSQRLQKYLQYASLKEGAADGIPDS